MDWPDPATRLLAAAPLAWKGNLEITQADAPARIAENPPFALMTRLLTYRNFRGFPFTVSAPPKACAAIADKALHLLAKRGVQSIWRLSDCQPPTVRLLRERHLLPLRSTPFPGKLGVKYLAVGRGSGTWAMVNEVEHLTFGQVFPGRLAAADFDSAYILPDEEPPEEGPSHTEAGASWSWSRKLGYLSSHPERIGPAMDVEMLVHLPGLALARKLPQARNAMAALGVGMFPASTLGTGEAEAGLFFLKSRGGAGKTANRVYAEFSGSVQPLVHWERRLQFACLEKHPKRLEDRVQDSMRRLIQARVLSYPELLALSSYLRLGAYLAILPPQIAGIAEELRVVAGSGHLGVSSGRTESARILAKEEEDIQRANVVRLALKTRHV